MSEKRIKELETKLFSLGLKGLSYNKEWQIMSKELNELKQKGDKK